MKKSLILVLALALIFSFSLTVYATSYSTSLSIDYRSTVTGSTRSFTGRSHKIENELTSRDLGSPTNNYCEFRLEKKVGNSSYTTKGTKTQNLTTVGNTYSSTYSGQTSGDFRYYIYNRYPSNDYRYASVDGFDCNQVTLSSK